METPNTDERQNQLELPGMPPHPNSATYVSVSDDLARALEVLRIGRVWTAQALSALSALSQRDVVLSNSDIPQAVKRIVCELWVTENRIRSIAERLRT